MRLIDNSKIVIKDALAATGGLQTAGNGVSMKDYMRCQIRLLVKCGNEDVAAGGAVTLKQGVDGTSVATALAFSEFWKNEDVLAGDTLTKVTASSLNAGVRNKTCLYVFEVRADQLDSHTFGSENIWIRLDLADITGATEAVELSYVLYEPRIARGAANMPSAF